MKPLNPEPEEIQLLNKAAQGIQILVELPDYGENFPSFGEMEIIYDTSMECAVGYDQSNGNIVLILYWEDEYDDGYIDYQIIPKDKDFTESILKKIEYHNDQYKEV
ncbi:MAG: hypothetical protein J7L15_01370 [Clostridiales bacterium]|nr:hypothetical protein [Clostridiales bacterium]